MKTTSDGKTFQELVDGDYLTEKEAAVVGIVLNFGCYARMLGISSDYSTNTKKLLYEQFVVEGIFYHLAKMLVLGGMSVTEAAKFVADACTLARDIMLSAEKEAHLDHLIADAAKKTELKA